MRTGSLSILNVVEGRTSGKGRLNNQEVKLVPPPSGSRGDLYDRLVDRRGMTRSLRSFGSPDHFLYFCSALNELLKKEKKKKEKEEE